MFPINVKMDPIGKLINPFDQQNLSNGFRIYVKEKKNKNVKQYKTLKVRGLETLKKNQDSYLEMKRKDLETKLNATNFTLSTKGRENLKPIFACPIELLDNHIEFWNNALKVTYSKWRLEARNNFLNRSSIRKVNSYQNTIENIINLWEENIADPLQTFIDSIITDNQKYLPFMEEEVKKLIFDYMDLICEKRPETLRLQKAMFEVINHYKDIKTLSWFQEWINQRVMPELERSNIYSKFFSEFELYKGNVLNNSAFYMQPLCQLLVALEDLIIYSTGCEEKVLVLDALDIIIDINPMRNSLLEDFLYAYENNPDSDETRDLFERLLVFPCKNRVKEFEIWRRERLQTLKDAEEEAKRKDDYPPALVDFRRRMNLKVYDIIKEFYIDIFSDTKKIDINYTQTLVRRLLDLLDFTQPPNSFDYINTIENKLRQELHDISLELNQGKYDPFVSITRQLTERDVIELHVSVSYAPFYQYNWYKDGTLIQKSINNISENTLKLSNPKSGRYYCEVYGFEIDTDVNATYYGISGMAVISIVSKCVRCEKMFDVYLDNLDETCIWSISPNFFDESIQSLKQSFSLDRKNFTFRGIIDKFFKESMKMYPQMNWSLYWNDPLIIKKDEIDKHKTSYLKFLYTIHKDSIISNQFKFNTVYDSFPWMYLLDVAQSFFNLKSRNENQKRKNYGTMNGDCPETFKNTRITKYSTQMQIEQGYYDPILESIQEIKEILGDSIEWMDTFAKETFEKYSNKRLNFYGSVYESESDRINERKGKIAKFTTQFAPIKNSNVFSSINPVFQGRHNTHKKSVDLACLEICPDKISYTHGSMRLNSGQRIYELHDQLEKDFIVLKEYWKTKSEKFKDTLCGFEEKIHAYNILLLNLPIM
jgi:hypothetical protein